MAAIFLFVLMFALVVGLSCIPALILQWILAQFSYHLPFWLCLAICWFIGYIGKVFRDD